MSHEEVLALLAACGESPTGVRHRALLALLYRSGLRINEALQLRPKDLDLANGAVRVLFGKGGTWRTVGVDAGAAAYIEEWVSVRAGWDLDPRAALFCTRHSRCIAQGFLRRLFKELAREAGIDRRVHAHELRHTHAARMRSERVDMGIISKPLGHGSITTARYLNHIAPHAAAAWLGHRVAVSAKHYLQVPGSMLEQAAGLTGRVDPARQPRPARRRQHPGKQAA